MKALGRASTPILVALTGALGGLWDFPLFPPEASAGARSVDILYFGLILMSLLILGLVFGLLLIFCVRYRAGSRADRTDPVRKSWTYEISWTAASLLIGLGLFVWAAVLYYDSRNPPPDAVTYYVVGKQWMWEIQHPDGRREINELHVPVGQTSRLALTSKDVIHSFYIPAFRMKMDVLPGRYTQEWFAPTRPGVYHLFCAEYCGADHAAMVGSVDVMTPQDYQAWLLNRAPAPTAQPLEKTGQAAFRKLGCNQCHIPGNSALAPELEGLYGTKVRLRDGTTVTADDEYIRESIIDPAAKVVAGYQAIMPTYKGIVDEEQLRQLIDAVRALGAQDRAPEGKQ